MLVSSVRYGNVKFSDIFIIFPPYCQALKSILNSALRNIVSILLWDN
nr:MAG TPA: hypothetical protein [Caudoviricetes sp.]